MLSQIETQIHTQRYQQIFQDLLKKDDNQQVYQALQEKLIQAFKSIRVITIQT